MKLIVSSDCNKIVNFERTRVVEIIWDGKDYALWADDDVKFSTHQKLGNAKKQLQEIVSIMTADGPVVYQAEDSQ